MSADAPIGTRVGEYEITGLLGRGGMGTVYAGVHPVIGKDVAIKVIAPHLATDAAIVARFVQEARAVNQIKHKNIIDVFAFGESPELGHYFVMPLLSGQNLADRIAVSGPMTVQDALPILEQITDALDAAHEVGVYHRDLKPENVFLVEERKGPPSVLILDFGIAKLTGGGSLTKTRTGVQMGTPLFMSPEQWDGIGVDHRSDIYALGVMLHHMVTGRYPFESESQMALMNLHADHVPVLPSHWGVPRFVDAIVERCLRKEPVARYQSAGQMFDALKSTAAGQPLTPSVPPPKQQLPSSATTLGVAAAQMTGARARRTPRSRWAIAGAVVLAAAVGGVTIGLVMSGPDGSGSATEPAAAPPPDAAPQQVASPVADAAVTPDATTTAVLDEPKTDKPTTDKPTTDRPTTDKPTTDKPTTDRPTTDKPTTDKPTTDKPTTDRPTTDKPTTDTPKKEDKWGDTTNPF